MTSLTHIVAATDLSAPARHAAERAALVSREIGATLDLLHVANLAPLERLRQLMSNEPDALQQRVLDTAREKLHDLAASVLKRYGVSSGAEVVAGSLLAELANKIDASDANLLVCGAKGESVIRHMLIGSTAERLLTNTNCPVLVVKHAPRDQYRTLLVPVDFSNNSLRAIRHAQAIAPKAELVLMHAFEVPFEGHLRYASVDDATINHYRVVARQEATQRMRLLCEAAGLSPYSARTVVVHGDRVLRIVEQEQEQDCDLIVMGKRGEGGIENFLVGSVTKRVLAESQGDVLVSV